MNYDKYLNRRIREIKPSGIRKFFDVADIYRDVISLGVGEPDFDTPWFARKAAIDSIRNGNTQYTSNSGLPALRKAISDYLQDRQQLEYDPQHEIFVTVGASEAIDLALRALLEPGDEVIIPEPSYVSYSPLVSLCFGTPVPAVCEAKDNFALMPEHLLESITPRTKALILPYPNNPTGAIMTREQVQAIARIAIERDLIVISDEIYSELTYGGRHASVAAVDGMRERTILINGFSKAFAMTGWRVGYVCAPEPLIRQMLKIHQYAIMCATTASQYAALSALNQSFEDRYASIEQMREEYDMRRRFLVAQLNRIGLETFEPRGAFYVFPCVSSLGMDGETFANELLREEHVAVVPGEAFGAVGKDYVRISYAYSIASLKRAMEKIERFVCRHKANK